MSRNNELDGTLRREWTKCSKPGCKRCAGNGHGPYWYSYYRTEGKLHKSYIGRWLPNEYEHLLKDAHEPIAYVRGATYWHKECIAARGYYGKDIDRLLEIAGLVKVHATLANRHLLENKQCPECGSPMRSACR